MVQSNNCLRLIKTEEGLIPPQADGLYHAYHGKADKAVVWTIGWGVTWYPNGRAVREGDKGGLEDITRWLNWHVDRAADKINAHLGNTTITQNQFDALVDIAYNIGADGILASTLFKKLLISPFDASIASFEMDAHGIPLVASGEFMKWVYSNGKVVDDLIWRRYRDANLYRGNDFKFKDGTSVSYS